MVEMKQTFGSIESSTSWQGKRPNGLRLIRYSIVENFNVLVVEV